MLQSPSAWSHIGKPLTLLPIACKEILEHTKGIDLVPQDLPNHSAVCVKRSIEGAPRPESNLSQFDDPLPKTYHQSPISNYRIAVAGLRLSVLPFIARILRFSND